MLEPIRDLIYSSDAGRPHGARQALGADAVASRSRTPRSSSAPRCWTTELTVEALLRLKVGDVIAVDVPATVQATVDGVPVFDCTYGARNGQYAIRIERPLRVPNEDRAPGEDHG